MKNLKFYFIMAGFLVCMILASMIPAVAAEAEETTFFQSVAVSGVEATSSHSSWPASYAIDGRVNGNCWSTGDDKPESAALTLNLSESSEVSSLLIYPRPGGDVTYFPADFEIRVSSDNSSWTTAKTVSGYSISDDTTPHRFDFDPQQNIQYVQLVVTRGSKDYIQMDEVIVGKMHSANAQELALSEVTGSSFSSSGWGYTKLIDGDTSTGWSSKQQSSENGAEFVQVELSQVASVNHVVLMPRKGQYALGASFPKDFTIQVSADGNAWETVVAKTGFTGRNSVNGEAFSFETKENIKYIKVNATKFTRDNGVKGNFFFQLMELKAYVVPSNLNDWAASITKLEVDADNAKLVLPEIDGITVEIASSSNEAFISTTGVVDVVNGGTSNVVLKLTDSSSNTATTQPIPVAFTGLLTTLTEKTGVGAITASSSHGSWPAYYMIDGNTNSNTFWSSGDEKPEQVEILVTLDSVADVQGVALYPRAIDYFPSDFEIFVSSDMENWTSAKKVSDYSCTSGCQYFYFDTQKDVRYVKLVIERDASSKYIQFAEIEVLAPLDKQTATEVAAALTVVAKSDSTVVIANVSDQFRTIITNSSNTDIIDTAGNTTLPAQDTEVDLTIQVTNRLDTTDVVTVTRKVLVKCQATLDAEALKDTVNFIICPANDATQITLPDAPEGYTITIAESSHPDVVDLNGKITRSDDTTYGVRLTFKLTNNTTGASALTDPLLVPIYKTYVAPTMTQEEIDVIREDYADNAYGIFIHYISRFNKYGGSRYADGTELMTVDEAANAFDAKAFAKTMNDVGAEYVVLTMWHGNMRTLFPSMTNQRWRDDRRAEGSTSAKSYAERDVIMELLDELDEYGIALHLYVHPSDGHDLSSEDKMLTSWDGTPNETWDQYTNELLYEICERYGTRIKGLWFDGMFANVKDPARMRATCLSFNPAMNMTMNVGLNKMGTIYTNSHPIVDNRAWEKNSWSGQFEDCNFSRHQTAAMIDGTGLWWIRYGKDKEVGTKTAEDTFRYMVAMSSISKQGGLLAATGFYPVHEGEVLEKYLYDVVYDQLTKMNNSYLQPVKESIQDTNDSTAYPTTENLTVRKLEWGVANESKDGRYIYLHVLNAPDGDTLTLPATADGTELRSDAVIMNFDETTAPLTIQRTAMGYSVTLPEGVSWSDVDTVIRAERTSVTGVTLDAETKDMETEETATLTATVQPENAYDKSVTWTSSDASVVTVDENGNLKAVGAGEATITVTTKDGGYTDTCKVTVTKSQTTPGGTGSGNDNTGSGNENTGGGNDNTGGGNDNTGGGNDNTGSGSENTGGGNEDTDSGSEDTDSGSEDTDSGSEDTDSGNEVTQNTTEKNPETGDSGYAQYVVLLAAAIMVIVAVNCYDKKREE